MYVCMYVCIYMYTLMDEDPSGCVYMYICMKVYACISPNSLPSMPGRFTFTATTLPSSSFALCTWAILEQKSNSNMELQPT